MGTQQVGANKNCIKVLREITYPWSSDSRNRLWFDGPATSNDSMEFCRTGLIGRVECISAEGGGSDGAGEDSILGNFSNLASRVGRSTVIELGG